MAKKKDKRSEADKARFNDHFAKVRDILAPYHARVLDEMPYGDGLATVYVLYSKEADAFEGRHRLRGVCTVLMTGDGSTCVCYSEDMIAPIIGTTRADTWDATTEALAKLLPALPPET